MAASVSAVEKQCAGCSHLLRQSRLGPQPFRVAQRRITACRSQKQPDAAVDRRALIVGVSAATLLAPLTAHATADDMQVLYGLDSPPTSYGGYGGNAKEAAKYTYEYPKGWKKEVVGKQEKGMVGIDSRVRNPRLKTQTVFTITFGRAGEDNKKFKLGDVETTLQGFAGADYDLQDTLIGATKRTSNTRDKDGQQFYDYEVDLTYLVSVALKGGKVFALFVKAPSKVFKNEEAQLRSVIDSFTIL